MAGKLKKLVVATSSSALFDLSESDRVYREEGVAAYAAYQIARESEPLAPGDAFPLVKKLLHLNQLLAGEEQVEVILLSRNTADTGLRVFNSIQHHALPISRAAFTGGSPPFRYMRPFRCHLFLSTNPEDVREALDNGMAAASILPAPQQPRQSDQLQFAFDGDAVLLWNFRGDRAIEISQAYESTTFTDFDRVDHPDVFYAGLLQYDGDQQVPRHYLVGPPASDHTMGEYLADAGMRCFAISETKKFGHVTFFWNGNRSGYINESLETYVEIPVTMCRSTRHLP